MEYIKINEQLQITDELDRSINLGQEFIGGLKITIDEIMELPEIKERLDEHEEAVTNLEDELGALEQDIEYKDEEIEELNKSIIALENENLILKNRPGFKRKEK